MAERLARQLRCSVIYDPDPDGPRNPWRTARECWRSTPAGCTHRLVIQEDTHPCAGFLHHARLALAAKPDRIVSFYLGQYPSETWREQLIASQRCAAWARGSWVSWVPAVALCIPQPLCASLAAFHDGTSPIADDEVYGRWCRTNQYPWWATIPSLVNHDDDAPSLMASPLRRGRRVAACWIGSVDPGLIDWTLD